MLEVGIGLLLLILPLVGLLTWWLRRGLRQAITPVTDIATVISRRDPDDLSPVAGTALPNELQPLVTSLNSYIGRVDDLRQAERQFIANAAHELRTPLAVIRARLDLSKDEGAQQTLPVLAAYSDSMESITSYRACPARMWFSG